jgi:hypothetical protein
MNNWGDQKRIEPPWAAAAITKTSANPGFFTIRASKQAGLSAAGRGLF